MNIKPKDPGIRDCHENLWSQFEKLATGRDGHEVVRALRLASDRVYAAGVDHAIVGVELTDNLAAAFNFTWLTIVLTELSKKKRVTR